MNYNYWIENLFARFDRKEVPVTFSIHALRRNEYWNLDLDRVEKTVRDEKIVYSRCEQPHKLCFEFYFGKENTTYVVVAAAHRDFVEVVTVWPRKGR